MMRLIVTISLIFLLSSCSILKSKNRKYEEIKQDSSSQSFSLNSKKNEEARVITFERNWTSEVSRLVHIYPKGRFELLEGGGFSGEADSVLIVNIHRSEEQTAGRQEDSNKSESQEASIEQVQESSSHTTEQLTKNKTTKPRFTSTIGALVLVIFIVLAVLYWLRKKMQFPFR